MMRAASEGGAEAGSFLVKSSVLSRKNSAASCSTIHVTPTTQM